MFKRRQFLQGGIFAGGAVLSLSSASRLLSQTAQAQSLEAVDFQLGWVKSVQFGGHFAAIENGYFAKEGIEADFKTGGPNIDPISLVASGQVKLGDAGSNDIIIARAQGTPIKAFACIFQKTPFALMSLKESPILSVPEMAGKTIAIPDFSRPPILALLQKNGLSESDVTFVPVGTDPAILATGQVDGYFGYATNQGIILKERGVDIEIVYTYDLGLVEYGNAFFTTDEVLETQSDLLVRWLRADIKGWQFAVENPEETARLMVDTYGQRGLDLEAQIAEAKAQVELIAGGLAEERGLCWISEEVFAQSIDLLANDFAAIESALDPSDVMTEAILEAAYQGATRIS
jgi:ABC-type nitrate/sulfonate/bicarbonate transport system substrate-binding protein